MEQIKKLEIEVSKLKLELNEKEKALNVLLNKKYIEEKDTDRSNNIFELYINDKMEKVFIDKNTLEGKELFARLITQSHVPNYRGTGLGHIIYNLIKPSDDIFKRTPEEPNDVPNFIQVNKGNYNWGIYSLSNSFLLDINGTETAIYRYSNGTSADNIEVNSDLVSQEGFICKEASYEEAVKEAYEAAQSYVRKYKMVI